MATVDPDLTAEAPNPSLMVGVNVPPLRDVENLRKKFGMCVNTFVHDAAYSWSQEDKCIEAIKYLRPWMIRTWIRKDDDQQVLFINKIINQTDRDNGDFLSPSITKMQFCGVLDRPYRENGTEILPSEIVTWVSNNYKTGQFDFFEGPNEWNLQYTGDHIPTHDWRVKLLEYQRGLWRNLALAPSYIRSVPLLTPSIGGRLSASFEGLSNLNDFCNEGNGHTYWGNKEPGSPGDLIDDAQAKIDKISLGKTINITECGWHDGYLSTNKGVANPPWASAIHLLPFIAEHDLPGRHFGWMANFALVDDKDPVAGDNDAERHFGLFFRTLNAAGNFTPKAHGIAFHNITTLLDERINPAVTWGNCSITITAEDANTMCRYYNMPDGRRLLVIWRRNIQVYDGTNHNPADQLHPGVKNVTINFNGTGALRDVKVYRPHLPNALSNFSPYDNVRSLTVSLEGEAVMIFMKPA